MQARTVALIGALGLVAGWALGGRFASQDPAAPPGGAVPRGPRPIGVEATTQTRALEQKLRQRLDRPARTPQPSRNPFVFGARSPGPASRGPELEAAPPPAPEMLAAPAPPPGPLFALAGMAATRTADGVVYTAIVNMSGELLFVKVGDPLPGGYSVVDVQERWVTIRDGSGGERTISLP